MGERGRVRERVSAHQHDEVLWEGVVRDCTRVPVLAEWALRGDSVRGEDTGDAGETQRMACAQYHININSVNRRMMLVRSLKASTLLPLLYSPQGHTRGDLSSLSV